MVNRIITHEKFLKKYLNTNNKYRPAQLKKANPEQLKCLCEAALNVVNGRVPIKPCQLKRLKEHSRFVRHIAASKAPIEKKQKQLVQKGGSILPIIISAVLSLLTSLKK
jgi:hypothetical protein